MKSMNTCLKTICLQPLAVKKCTSKEIQTWKTYTSGSKLIEQHFKSTKVSHLYTKDKEENYPKKRGQGNKCGSKKRDEQKQRTEWTKGSFCLLSGISSGSTRRHQTWIFLILLQQHCFPVDKHTCENRASFSKLKITRWEHKQFKF